jgi:hypothetical protein
MQPPTSQFFCGTDGEDDSYPNICCFIVDCCKSPAINLLSNNIIIIIRRVGRSKEKSLLLLPLFRCFFSQHFLLLA